MEIKIGFIQSQRELRLETELTAQAVRQAYADALASDTGILELTDKNGSSVLIRADKVAYIDLGKENARPVGFGSV